MRESEMTAPRPDEVAACAYNLFRRHHDPEIHCAVPEDRAVPGFVSHGWSFAGKAGAGSPHPDGFDAKAASVGVRFNGYHLFHG